MVSLALSLGPRQIQNRKPLVKLPTLAHPSVSLHACLILSALLLASCDVTQKYQPPGSPVIETPVAALSPGTPAQAPAPVATETARFAGVYVCTEAILNDLRKGESEVSRISPDAQKNVIITGDPEDAGIRLTSDGGEEFIRVLRKDSPGVYSYSMGLSDGHTESTLTFSGGNRLQEEFHFVNSEGEDAAIITREYEWRSGEE